MKNLMLVLMLILLQQVAAQTAQEIPLVLNPKADLVLKLPSDGKGTNGSAVAWHPIHKKYYTIVAGNVDFPIDVFDASGNHLQTSPARVDLRGFWYNSAYNALEGNTYYDHDVMSYRLDQNGLITNDSVQLSLYELPVWGDNNVAAINNIAGVYISVTFDSASAIITMADIDFPEIFDDLVVSLPVSPDNMNFTSIGCTGVKGYEYALLNVTDKKVYIISDELMQIVTTINLPSNAPTNNSFRFSVANGYLWLFDATTRSWTGYRIVK